MTTWQCILIKPLSKAMLWPSDVLSCTDTLISELGHHWLRQWLGTCSKPSHYQSKCCFIYNWTKYWSLGHNELSINNHEFEQHHHFRFQFPDILNEACNGSLMPGTLFIAEFALKPTNEAKFIINQIGVSLIGKQCNTRHYQILH